MAGDLGEARIMIPFSKKKKSYRYLAASLVLLAIFFVFALFKPDFFWLKSLTHNLVQRPITAVFNFLGEKADASIWFFEGAFFRGQEKEALEKMNLILKTENIRLKETVKENQFLKNNLHVLQKSKTEMIMAQVTAKAQDVANSVLIINRGKKDGIRSGQAVIAGPSILLGKVFEVGEKFAKVRLLLDPQSLVNVIVQQKNLQGTLRGEYGLGLLLEKVPWDQKLEKGDVILSSGLGDDSPSGLLIGQIESLNKDEAELAQSARVTPATEIKVLDYVFVIK